jgi:hypothetical protein
MSEAMDEVLRRAHALGTPEAMLLHEYYSNFTGTAEELQASTEEMMSIILSFQFVAYSGKIHGAN